jgi:putative FmdB family regulatory protein
MPTYEYVCKQCGHRVEVVQSLSEEPLKTCGVCGGELRKVFHPAGVLFKGSGFYSTDNRAKAKDSDSASSDAAQRSSKGAKEAAGSSSSSSSGSESSGSGGSGGSGGSEGSGSGGSKESGGSGGSKESRGSSGREGSGSGGPSGERRAPKPAKDES